MKAKQLSNALARRVEELAPRLLPEGKRAGNYWQAGDITGGAGSSLYLHLTGPMRGQWRDAATGEHGDLLDLIALRDNTTIAEAMIKAPALIGNRDLSPVERVGSKNLEYDTKKTAIALWQRARPLMTPYGAHGQAYLKARGVDLFKCLDLRFHRGAWLDVTDCLQGVPTSYEITRTKQGRSVVTLPALVAAVRGGAGDLIAVHRTFLDPNKPIKALIPNPKRAKGKLTGGACWLRREGDCLIVAEGIETAMSVGMAFPKAALAAGITAHHLTMMEIPYQYQRILIAADNDDAGLRAAEQLTERMNGRCVITVTAHAKDFNDDLRFNNLENMKKRLIQQINLIKMKREEEQS